MGTDHVLWGKNWLPQLEDLSRELTEFIFSFREENVSHKITESFMADFSCKHNVQKFQFLKN